MVYRSRRHFKNLLAFLLLILVGADLLCAGEWPTYRHDNQRSGITAEKITLPLKPIWERRSQLPPQTAWPGPAKWDAYAGNKGLQSLRNFDPCFYVTAADGRVFFGSSVDHAAHCLDAATGAERWVVFADAPVRLPPTLHGQLALFGSDDGHVRAVRQTDGKEVWSVRSDAPRVWNNGQLIALRPIRTGVLVDAERDRAYFGGSLVPWETSTLTAVHPVTGAPVFAREHKQMTLQGAMLLAGERLIVPQGRSEPLLFDTKDGAAKGAIANSGGVFCLVTDEGEVVTGPRNQKAPEDLLRLVDPASGKKALMQVSGADRLLVKGSTVFAYQGKQLVSLDREKMGKKGVDPKHWSLGCAVPHDMILAGDTLFVGLQDRVIAVDAKTGKEVWQVAVDGRAFGLAVSDGRLFVSTSLGHIFAFGY